jgi:hypothetical protein
MQYFTHKLLKIIDNKKISDRRKERKGGLFMENEENISINRFKQNKQATRFGLVVRDLASIHEVLGCKPKNKNKRVTLQLSIKMNRSLSKLIDYYHNSKM